METTRFGRVIAIGDIHGCAFALEAVLDAIAPRRDDLIISLGDFVDTGRNTKETIERLLQLRNECTFVALMGNHEEMLLGALTSEKLKHSWEMCGGVSTCNSYRFGGGIDDIPEDHLAFIRECVGFVETEDHLFVHANYVPDLPPAEFPDYVLRWSLLDDPHPEPHCSGKTVIVGHTEQRNGEVIDLGPVKCIDTYCHGSGWLTALEVRTGEIWQASRWSMMRDED